MKPAGEAMGVFQQRESTGFIQYRKLSSPEQDMGRNMTFTPTLAAPLSRTTLLVVDEKPLFRDMVRAAFLTKVRGVREATDMDKALDILRHAGSDVGCVICDWDMMPVGGLELLRMIRAGTVSGTSPRTPV